MKPPVGYRPNTVGLPELDHCVSPPSTRVGHIYKIKEGPMSPEEETTWDTGSLKENISKPTSPIIKGTPRISMKVSGLIEAKEKPNEEPTNPFVSPHIPADLPTGHVYKHSCHTCGIHFPIEKGFEKHILESEAHKSFKLTADIAEGFGYLNPSDTNIELGSLSPKTLSHSDVLGYFGCHHQYRANELGPCKKRNCTCPRFEFALPKHPIPTAIIDQRGLLEPLFLDGIAGSTMYGEIRDEEEEDTLGFSLKRPHPPSDEDEGPYVRPPDSDDEEEMAQHKAAEEQKRKDEAAAAIAAAEAERQRRIQDEADMRWRFAKGKNRRAARIAQQKADRAVYEAYIAADETLFGQQRFEEIAEEEVVIPPQGLLPNAVVWTKEARESAIANWQREMGQTDYNVEAKKFESDLAEQIDSLIMDTLFEVALQESEEKRNKASAQYKNKLFFEDTLEDIAINHEFTIEDKYQEKLRKVLGKEQTKKLNGLRMEDIVDDIAMGHVQEVAERGEEKHRIMGGRKQTKELNCLKLGDMVDDIAMDHNQEVGEREEEHYRKRVGRRQDKTLSDLRMGDLVDDLVMDHIQETGEREKENYRKRMGRIQGRELSGLRMDDLVNDLVMDHTQEIGEREEERRRRKVGRAESKELFRLKMEDIVENLVMDHNQEIDEKTGEHRREIMGKIQNKKIADIQVDDMVHDLAMTHDQEVHERSQEYQRKISGFRQTKKLKGMEGGEEDIIENMAMGHFQAISEKANEHQRKMIGTKQSKKLAAFREDNLVDLLVMDHMQDVGEKEQEHYRNIIGRQQNRDLTASDMDDIASNIASGCNKIVGGYGENRGFVTGRMDEMAEPLADEYNTEPRRKAAAEKKKSEAFLTRFFPKNMDRGVRIDEDASIGSQSGKERGGEWYEHDGGVKLPEVPTDAGARHQLSDTNRKATDPIAESSSKQYEYDDDGYISPVPVPKKTIKQKRKEAQDKYNAMIEDMARAQQR